MDFMQRATEAVHPRNKVISLPKDLKIIINWNREVYTYNIFNYRIKFVKYWTDRAQQLRNENKKLLQRAPEHLHGLLKGKRLALCQTMVDHFDYPDKRLVSAILQGFPIAGWLPDSNIFPKDIKPQSLDINSLVSLSKGMNAHVKAKVFATNPNDLVIVT